MEREGSGPYHFLILEALREGGWQTGGSNKYKMERGGEGIYLLPDLEGLPWAGRCGCWVDRVD